MQQTINSEAVSIAKGLGIILMAIGHAGCPEWMFYFIYLFHMPLFFWLSGYCFKEKYLDDKQTFVKHRLKGLYVPIVKYNLIFIVLHNLLYTLKIYKETYTFNDIIDRVLNVFTLSYLEINLNQYWFLRYLLLSSLIFLLLRYVSRKRPELIKYGFFLIPLIAIVSNHYQISQLISTVMLLSFFFYIAGYLAKSTPINTRLWVIIGGFIVVAVASIFIHSLMLRMKTADILPYCLFALIGIYATYALSIRISTNETWFKKMLVYIGNHTMVILTWHFLLYDFINLFYLKFILCSDFSSVEEESLHQQLGGLHFLVYSVLGITIPLLLQWLFSKKNIKQWLHIR